jgi:glycosyltransferase involved in cell wall biosynthesis
MSVTPLPNPLITLVIPTIDGREDSLARCISSYQEHTDDYEIIVVHNAPNCGVVWQWAAEHSTGDYIAFSADDLEAHEGWWQEATTMIDHDVLPAPLIFNADGTVQSCGASWETLEPDHAYTEFTRAPFVSRRQWDRAIKPMIPIHYYTDNYASERARLNGIPTVVCHSYKLTHHTADEGRGAGLSWDGRMAADHRLCLMYLEGEIPIPEGDDAWQPPTSASQRLRGNTATKSLTIPAKPAPATSPS